MVERSQAAARFVEAFVVFVLRNAVFDDPCSDAERRLSFAKEHCPDRDREIDVAGEIDVAKRASVDSARALLEVPDDLHRADFRRTCERSCREDGPNDV